MWNKDAMAYMKDILVYVENNYHPFINSVNYTWAKFLQASKILKESIDMFFYNPDLALMQEQLSYKNVVEMRALLIKLAYSKITS